MEESICRIELETEDALFIAKVQTDMGGPNALIDTKTSVKGMTEVIDNLVLKNSGRFYNYDGSLIPW